MKVGFIGLGNMGSAIAVGLLDNGGLEPGQVQLANRSPGKAEDLCLRFPGAEVVKENGRLAEQCDIVFVSVRADQVLDVLKEISSQRQGSHLVITNGGFTLDQMEKICPGAVSKLILDTEVAMSLGYNPENGSWEVPMDSEIYLNILGPDQTLPIYPKFKVS
ncbi:MAG: NAD(P)-binding domain-containing protein, partial [Methanomassiliicoccales archaeon]|nr:NAD(P)-binding domain-containing protein [Methanomassiliicoccales archaeon]